MVDSAFDLASAQRYSTNEFALASVRATKAAKRLHALREVSKLIDRQIWDASSEAKQAKSIFTEARQAWTEALIHSENTVTTYETMLEAARTMKHADETSAAKHRAFADLQKEIATAEHEALTAHEHFQQAQLAWIQSLEG